MSCEYCENNVWKHFIIEGLRFNFCPICGAALDGETVCGKGPVGAESHTRAEILDAAKQCVCQDRNIQYGTPEDCFNLIACFWSDYLRITYFGDDEDYSIVDAKDVAVMMVLLKIARVAVGASKSDNWIDIAGYAACGGELDKV